MTKIFLSHSSIDKPMIRQLAFDLLMNGEQVWLDEKEISAGDSLNDKIFDAIDGAAYVILALSTSSISSKWVNREINAALAREDQLEKKILIPIALDTSQAPTKIADRLYIKFYAGYNKALYGLIDQISKYDEDRLEQKQRSTILPISFSNGADVDKSLLNEYLSSQFEKYGTDKLHIDELFILDHTNIDLAKGTLFDIVDQTSSGEIKDYAKSQILRMRKLENALRSGILNIVNNASRMHMGAAIPCFVKIIRMELITVFAEFYKNIDALNPKDYPYFPLSNPKNCAELYGGGEHIKVDIYHNTSNEYFSVFVEKTLAENEVIVPGTSIEVNSLRGSRIFWDYIIPQMVAKHFFYSGMTSPLEWEFNDGWFAGVG